MRRVLLPLLLAACGDAPPCTLEGGRMICPGGTSELPATCTFEQLDAEHHRLVCPGGTSAVIEDASCTIEGDALLCPGVQVPLQRDVPVEVTGTAERYLRDGSGIRLRVGGREPVTLRGSSYAIELPVGLHELAFEADGYEGATRQVLALPGGTSVDPVVLLPGVTLDVVAVGSPRVLAGGVAFAVSSVVDGASATAVFLADARAPLAVVAGASVTGDDARGAVLSGPSGTAFLDLASSEVVPIEDCVYATLAGGLVVCSGTEGWRVWDPGTRTSRAVSSVTRPQVSPGRTWIVTYDGRLSTFEHQPSGKRTLVTGSGVYFFTDRLALVNGAFLSATGDTVEPTGVPYRQAWVLAGGVVVQDGAELVLWDDDLVERGRWACPSPCYGPAVSPGAPAFALLLDAGISFYDSGGLRIARWKGGGVAAVSPVAPYIVVARTVSNELWLYRADTDVAIRGPSSWSAAAASPSNRRLALFDGASGVWIADTETGALERLTEGTTSVFGHGGFAGDDHVFVLSYEDQVLRRFDLRTGSVLPIVPSPIEVTPLAKGSLLVFTDRGLRRVDP